ncbi:RDD family protein [Halovulum dunhuangense]|uniref:RDD family protein n=1 Tax=Halovulum dunhuangense TaxID=1505036 RepID=A0A849L5Z2_9RHOB|nr:RDD family protein [Halovulum dunhuangense]NNU81527.1 RDD family protein [Halovulum dunhuangense]
MSPPAPRKEEPPRIIEIVPPEGVPIRFDVAGLGARFVAQLADILLSLAAVIAVMALLFLSELIPMTGLVTVGALLFFAIRAPYYILAEILMNGQTFGKRLSGLRVIAVDGRSLSPHAVTVRNLMKEMEVFVPGTLLLTSASLSWPAALLLMAWISVLLAVPLLNPMRQRLGDILAGTYVVTLPVPILLPDLADAPQDQGRFNFLPHHLDHYGRYELQTLESLLQANRDAMGRGAAARHDDNLRRVAATIARRIGYTGRLDPDAAEAFLRVFYRTQRAYLENRKLFGDAREDKFHRSQGGKSGPRGG